jgi:cytochrome c peroxidase
LPDPTPASDDLAFDEKVKLGKKLFHDVRLSENQTLSCNSCHTLSNYGVDNEPKSPGTEGQLGDRNSPTVYNAALHIAQFWDGRAKDVEEQALGPVLNPKEMAMPSAEVVIKRLRKDVNYKAEFADAFPDESEPVTFENVGRAIGAFERTLLTPSRFDLYLKGDKAALTQAEKDGLKKFIEVGCAACHNGTLLGGNSYQKLGLVKPYTKANPDDHGRVAVTNNPAEDMVFKVPSLRNVEKTAPYYHDGSIKTLDRAVRVMAEYQLGKKLPDADVQAIVTFLHSLTGRLPKGIVKQNRGL